MKLDVRHTFPFSADVYWQTFWDDEFEATVASNANMDREVLSDTMEGDVLVRRQRFTSLVPLPMPVKKIIGSDTLTYEQISRIDKANGRIDWEVIPPVQEDKVVAKGTFVVNDLPGGGCERVIDGEVTVKVRFVGGQIEKVIVGAITKSYEDGAAKRTQWVADRGLA